MCEFSQRLVAWLDGELPEGEAAKIERHLGSVRNAAGSLMRTRKRAMRSRRTATHTATRRCLPSRAEYRWAGAGRFRGRGDCGHGRCVFPVYGAHSAFADPHFSGNRQHCGHIAAPADRAEGVSQDRPGLLR